MLLKQMKYFVTVVDCHSFTEAAELCYISQSAISQQIRLLEQEMGVELLKREKRTFTLTPAGEYFYRHSVDILDEIERLQSETKQIGEYDDAKLKIGVLKNFGGSQLREGIAKFSETYPEVMLDIVNGTHEELYDLLRFGEADMVLNDHRRAFSDLYVNYHLVTSQCFVEISTKNRLSSKEYVTLDDLKHLPCILVTSSTQAEHESDYYKNTLGYGGNFLYAQDLETARIMVAGNRGFMPIDDFSNDNYYKTIKRIPLYRDDHQLERDYCLFWKVENSGYYVEELASILSSAFNKK